MAVKYDHLNGIFVDRVEKGLSILPPARGPRTLVLGTASDGQADDLYTVRDAASAASEFGSSGTLTRGMYEAMQAGAENVVLLRIGSTSAKLEHVGDSTGVAGYTIETIRRDDDAGARYSIYYDDTTDRLVVWNVQTGIIVYDNDSTSPIDLEEVIVSGSRATGGGPDIAGPSAGFALEDVVSLGHAGTAYTAGTDGVSPSRMELFQFLYKAYKTILGRDFDYIIPMDVYLDDLNVVDGDAFSATYLASILSGSGFPTASSSDDILGKVFVEQYAGDYYFFWDLNSDGQAELFPSGVGSASATTKIDGNSLSAADFHEVNFAYQLAYFCYENTVNNKFNLGVIGTKPPASSALADVNAWIGKLPVYTTSSTGAVTVDRLQDNGSGLLGNKFMAGSYSFRGGEGPGGFILTDSEWLDGIEQSDANGYKIDIGTHISITCAYLRLFNAWDTSGFGYSATAAATYMGYVSALDEINGPSNSVISGVHPAFELGPRHIDQLSGRGYVFIFERPKGLTIADAPTAGLPTSDYVRLMTMRIVKRCVGVVRDAGDPFVGKGFSRERKAAANIAISSALDKLVKAGYISRYEMDITQTRAQIPLGLADLKLTLVPAWELRRITVTVALSPQ